MLLLHSHFNVRDILTRLFAGGAMSLGLPTATYFTNTSHPCNAGMETLPTAQLVRCQDRIWA